MTGSSDRIREYALRGFIEPARKRGDSTVRIVAGEIQKALHLHNRTPQVCSALQTKKFLEENHLSLEKLEGPASGMSTTVVFTYRLQRENTGAEGGDAESPLQRLWGIGRDVFQSLGGGEAFIRNERDHFYGPGKRS